MTNDVITPQVHIDLAYLADYRRIHDFGKSCRRLIGWESNSCCCFELFTKNMIILRNPEASELATNTHVPDTDRSANVYFFFLSTALLHITARKTRI